jgi:hypothetical protein
MEECDTEVAAERLAITNTNNNPNSVMPPAGKTRKADHPQNIPDRSDKVR